MNAKREVSLFCDRLRLCLAQVDEVDLGLLNEKTAATRLDQLFELGADFSDAVDLFERGIVNETVLREAAVAVAVEAVKVWLATCGLGREEPTDGR